MDIVAQALSISNEVSALSAGLHGHFVSYLLTIHPPDPFFVPVQIYHVCLNSYQCFLKIAPGNLESGSLKGMW